MTLRVLLVEDEPDIRLIAQAALLREGLARGVLDEVAAEQEVVLQAGSESRAGPVPGDEARTALDGLQEAVAEADDPERRDLVRKVMVAIFTELGVDHPLSREHRRRLAVALT